MRKERNDADWPAGGRAPDVVYKFGHTAAAPGAARRALRPLGIDGELAGAVELVASELVTNVVLHTGNGGEVRAWASNPVRLEVEDTSTAMPTPRFDPAVGGRGLRIVDQIAHRWGTTMVDHGKVVWAMFDRTEPQIR